MEGTELSKKELFMELLDADIISYLKYKIRATFRQPDMDRITTGLWIGGQPKKEPIGFIILNLRDIVPEGKEFSIVYLKKIVDGISKQIKSGNRVFVHCRHGRGRAPMVAVAYLAIKNKSFMTLGECIELVQYFRPNVYLTEGQLKTLQLFYDKYVRDKK